MAFDFVSGSGAVVFMVAAGLVFEVVAAMCSSPQTAEINADKRAATLMKWVWIGLVVAGLFVWISATKLKGGPPAVWGGGLAAGLMLAAYWHAKRAGLASNAGGTES